MQPAGVNCYSIDLTNKPTTKYAGSRYRQCKPSLLLKGHKSKDTEHAQMLFLLHIELLLQLPTISVKDIKKTSINLK